LTTERGVDIVKHNHQSSIVSTVVVVVAAAVWLSACGIAGRRAQWPPPVGFYVFYVPGSASQQKINNTAIADGDQTFVNGQLSSFVYFGREHPVCYHCVPLAYSVLSVSSLIFPRTLRGLLLSNRSRSVARTDCWPLARGIGHSTLPPTWEKHSVYLYG